MAKMVRIPAFAELVRALRAGESLSRTARIPLGEEESAEANKALARLRNTVNQSVSKARQDGSNFKVESGAFISDDYSGLIITVAVTRMSGEAAVFDEAQEDEDDEEHDI